MKQRSAKSATGWGLQDLPNVITVLRILAVAPLVWMLVSDRYTAALWIAFFAGLSDAVRGGQHGGPPTQPPLSSMRR